MKLDTERIISRLYAQGFSQARIADLLGVAQPTIHSFMRRRSIPARSSGQKRGTKHPCSRNSTNYFTLQHRVSRLRGTPNECEECGCTDPAKRYDWANVTGNYADVRDYKRLCRRCHFNQHLAEGWSNSGG